MESGFTNNSKETDGFRKERLHGLLSKTDEKQAAQTLHQPCVVASRTTLLVNILTNLERRECVVFDINFKVKCATDIPTSG